MQATFGQKGHSEPFHMQAEKKQYYRQRPETCWIITEVDFDEALNMWTPDNCSYLKEALFGPQRNHFKISKSKI